MVCEMQINGGWGLYLFISFFIKFVVSLKCYHCNNLENPACGMYFKPYQFTAQPCSGEEEDVKCALQRELPKGKEHWVGIIRSCYRIGSLDVNETNGCHQMNITGHAAKLCLCDTDYCNHATGTCWPYVSITTAISLVILFLYHL
ncbi:uncharacterized protein LOC133187432 [Saccostrea echinata]|uniref:uncharacterized protein LOC133187432 n=1 Tax=Saccostrea echinata TaxID=191078 RepID=UPI002A806C60|nr:uncharacterized protein LOC133187432 [Saccostrea echinata]XP_061178900.1 uncharacterized protein LOC133187432 [Saccostrea echinata]XP_061178977.1 uncharacterized protein LOC133187432 [Saccostrea echinata]